MNDFVGEVVGVVVKYDEVGVYGDDVVIIGVCCVECV